MKLFIFCIILVTETEALNCSAPLSPANGEVNTTEGLSSGATATYSCNVGYVLIGAPTTTCTTDGTWSGTSPTCEIVDCGQPPNILNGFFTTTSTQYLGIVFYSCREGYIISGTAILTCDAGGLWSGIVPSCDIVDCGPPTQPVGLVVSYNTTVYQSVANYSCDYGYNNLNGSDFLTCEADGLWSGTTPQCDLIDCGPPPIVPNSIPLILGTLPLAGTIYSCEPGYTLLGSGVLTCDFDGTYYGEIPQCNPIDFGQPPSIVNGNLSVSNTTYGETVLYSCNSGYTLSGSVTLTCNASGSWNAAAPTCDGTQSNLSHSDNGSLHCETIGRSPQSRMKMDTVDSGVISGFLFLQTVTNTNVVRCARMCTERMRAACGAPPTCHMIQYHDISRSCDLYHADAYGNNVTCSVGSQCYRYEHYTLFL